MIQYDSSEDDLKLNYTQAILKPGTLKNKNANCNWILAIKWEKSRKFIFLYLEGYYTRFWCAEQNKCIYKT